MATQLAETVTEAPVVATTQESEKPQLSVIERDFETEARSQGWTDKDAFKGDPNKWVDAETFVKRADEVMPFLKKQNGALKRELDEVKATVKRLTRAETTAYQAGLDAARKEMRDAVQTGDTAAYEAAEKKLDKLQSDAGTAKETVDPRPAFAAFREANEWYDLGNQSGATELERRARAKADVIADRLVSQGLHEQLTPEEFFQRVADDTLAAIPQLASPTTARAKPGSDVAGVTRPGTSRTARIGSNLPQEAKDHAERYMNAGIYKVKTKQEAYDLFAKSFDWDGWAKRN